MTDSCRSNWTVGGECGEKFIDGAILEWLQPKLENIDLVDKDFHARGHFVLTKRGRILLERFERHKNVFSGSESCDIPLLRGISMRDDQQDGIVNGLMTLTK